MPLPTRLRHALRALFRRGDVERELESEVKFHLEMEAMAHERAGSPAHEARVNALRSFGGIEQAKEACRDSWGTRFFDHLRQDLGYGLRGLRHNPGFSFVVIVTLALGIGANTAIFSVVHGVLLRDLPFAAPDRLVVLTQSAPKAGQPSLGFSVPDFTDFRERSRAFSGLAEYHSMWFILLGRPEPERVQTAVVSDNYFDVIGVKPILGRGFLPGEDKPGAPAVLVLSHDFWQRSFGGDPQVIGQVFEMNNRPHTVVGVLPPLPAFPAGDHVYMPASACPFRGAERTLTNRNGRIIASVVGRLKDSVSPQQAQADTKRVAAELCGAFPQNYPVDGGYTADTQTLARAFTGNARTPLLVLLATSGFVLLIACANVANLTLARLVRRDRELAVRVALGAGRRRIFRQLLTESTLLALLGGTAGLALAAGGMKLLVGYSSRFLPRSDEIAIDGTVLLFTLGVSLVTGLFFGSRAPLPAADALAHTLKDGTRGTSAGRPRLRALLVIGQVAISVPLMVGAGLAARSLFNLQRVDPGLDTDRVLAANLNLNWTRYNDFPKRFGFWERAMNEAATLPGVQSVAIAGVEPLNGLVNAPAAFRIEHQPLAPNAPAPRATVLVTSEDYFTTIGQPLLRGRFFRPSDNAEAPNVVIVNQSLASRFWPTDDPVGRRITFDNGTNWSTIVGVVANARQQLNSAPVDEIHVPLRDTGGLIAGTILVRTQIAPGALSRDLREAIRRADPQQPVTRIETLEEVRTNSLGAPRLIATLLGLFALLALIITAAGIGGVLAFSVGQRTQEIGIRMALGASRGAVLWMVLRQGLGLVAIGLALGVSGAFFLTRLMTAVLYDVPPTDPATFALVVTVLLVVATIACVAPARRATGINPVVALRAT
jgi:putative ABC transport system permease protein